MSWSSWWISLALVALLAPGVAAQVEGPYVELTVTPHGTPLEPITGEGQALVDVVVKCETGAVYDQQGALPVALDVEIENDWLVAVLDATALTFEISPAECLAGVEKNETVVMGLFATKDAPALETSMITLTATPTPGDAATKYWNETAGVFMKVVTRFDKTVDQARAGQEITFPLVVLNAGNGAIRASFTPNANTSEELEVQVPEEIEVAAGDEGTVEVTVAAPSGGWKGEVATLNIIIDATAVDDTSLTSQSHVTALVRGNPFTEESPLPSFVSLLIVLACVALLHRQRS